MPWPNTEEGRERKRIYQREWWHKKFGGQEKRMNEEYPKDETKTPHVLTSEMEDLLVRVQALHKHIAELKEKRDRVHPDVITHAVDKFGSPLDEVELKAVQEEENARVERLRQRYDEAIAEKEKEYEANEAYDAGYRAISIYNDKEDEHGEV